MSKIVVLSECRAEICTEVLLWMSTVSRLRRWLEILDQPKLIRVASAPILDNIHALANEMQTEAARFDFVEATAAQF
jgi:hypothetical protein